MESIEFLMIEIAPNNALSSSVRGLSNRIEHIKSKATNSNNNTATNPTNNHEISIVVAAFSLLAAAGDARLFSTNNANFSSALDVPVTSSNAETFSL
jgi:hypothetical protein